MTVVRRSVLAAVMALVASTMTVAAGPPTGAGDLDVATGGIEQLDTFGRAVVEVDGRKLVSVVVDLDHDSVATYRGGEAGYEATSPEVTGEQLDADDPEAQAYEEHLRDEQAAFDRDLRGAIDGARVTGNLTWIVGGVTALVPPDDVERVAGLRGVQGVYLDQMEQLQTDASPEFIGAPAAWDHLGGQDDAGEGVVVGVLDTGIWPEHPSVSDPDPAGEAYPAPPSTWSTSTTRDPCDFGDTTANASDDPFACNNKLLAAYDFTDTYKAAIGLLPTEFDSARDSNGHGTHTLTTAAGNGGVDATLLGVPRGEVTGIAPRAHVAAYKVCGLLGCFSSDSVAAVQQAILDGVDVLNFSISGGGSPYSDPVSLAFRDAYAAGIVVNASAGNSGPGAETVAHREPWTVTVGASTSDRHFLSTVMLTADNGDTLEVTGASVTSGITAPTPVVISPDTQCTAGMAPGTFSGEIVLCDRGFFARVVKSYNVQQAGGGGMLLANLAPQGLATDNHFIPSVHLENVDGNVVRSFVSSHTGVMATFTDGTATTVPGDVMAAFSSRGGPAQPLGISKPDVTAPGVQVLAGHTPMPEDAAGGQPGELFQSIQGTSMSSPHSAGVAALVTAAHPDWTAGQRKSAMMLSAQGATVLQEDGTTPATAFDMGSGSIRPLPAIEVGLTMDESAADYTALESNLWDANYPSLYVPELAGTLTVERTVMNVTSGHAKWDLTVEAPADLVVTVPKKLQIAPGADATFPITVDGRSIPFGETRHATLLLTDKQQGQTLRFPITVVRRAGDVTLTTSCTPDQVVWKATTTCTIEAANQALVPAAVHIEDVLPKQLRVDASTIVGGTGNHKQVEADATLAAAQPPTVAAAVGSAATPFGYFPLSTFGIPAFGSGDEAITNFNVPSYDYAGVAHTVLGVVSNGYLVVGGGTGADVDYVNDPMPDAAPPNNVLAPFWTDLDPSVGGALRIALVSGGGSTWIVVDWEGVPNWGSGTPNSFQAWIPSAGPATADGIGFAYGVVSAGDGGFLTVGAENADGTSGQAVYFDGAGAAPTPTNATGYAVDVTSVAGAPGGTHTVTFEASGHQVGSWVNDVRMWTDLVPGVVVARETGAVVR